MARARALARAFFSPGSGVLGWGRFIFCFFCGRKASFGWGLFLAFPAEILGGKGFKKGGEGT